MDAPSTSKAKPFLLAWCICLLIMEFCGLEFVASGIHTRFDFRSFYAAGYLARTHPSQLYNLSQQQQIQDILVSRGVSLLAFYHPSYETLMYTPFSFLDYRTAYLAFIAFNLLLLLATLFAAPLAKWQNVPWLQSRPWLTFFLFLPLLISVAHGQDSILILVLCCVAWRQLHSGKDLNAGCILALALFKFQIILPIVALIGIRRGWRFITGFLVASAGVTLLCLGVGGLSGMSAYLRLLTGASSAVGKSALAQQRLSVFPLAMPNLSGLLYACGARLLHPAMAFDALVVACSLGLFLWCARAVRRSDDCTSFSIAILCGLLVSYHLYIYDLTPLLLPIALLADCAQRYIVLSLFVLPLILLPFGSNSFFLLAVPSLAMLIYAIVSSPRVVITHEPTHAPAR
jgi:hypothetical protein